MKSLSAWFETMERQGVMTAKDIQEAFRVWLERLAEEKRFLKPDRTPHPGMLAKYFGYSAHSIRYWLEMRAEPTVETIVNVICHKEGLHPDEFYSQLRTINAELKGAAEDEARKSATEMLYFYRNMNREERNKMRMAILSEISQEVESQLSNTPTEYPEELLVG